VAKGCKDRVKASVPTIVSKSAAAKGRIHDICTTCFDWILLRNCAGWLGSGFLFSQSAPPSTSIAAPANPHQAYTLPPDKLVKAIAISRIRNVLDIVGPLWGLVFSGCCWLPAPLPVLRLACADLSRRWQQGLLFFAVFLIVTTLAGLPIDVYGTTSRALTASAFKVGAAGWATRLNRSLS